MSSSTPVGTLLATANSFSDLHALATFHDLRHALEQPLRRLWERGFIDEAAATALRSAMPHAGSAALRELLASHEVQRELKRRTASEVRRSIPRGAVRLMQQPEPAASRTSKRNAAGAADEVPEGGEDLLEWAQAAGIPEALDAPAAQRRSHHTHSRCVKATRMDGDPRDEGWGGETPDHAGIRGQGLAVDV